MKHIINGFLVVLALCMPVFAADVPRETKKVCVDQKDKAGNPVYDRLLRYIRCAQNSH